MATSKPEVLTTSAVNKVETRFRRLHRGFRWRLDDWHTTRHRNMHARYQIQRSHSLSYKYFRFWCRHCLITWCIFINPHTTELERQLSHIQIYFIRLMVELYIDEQRNIHIWYIIRHGDLKTGSSYKLGREKRSDAIPTATRIFMNTPMRLDH